jgi:signal transduction histidine kinase
MSLLKKTLLYLLLVAVPVAVLGGWLFHSLVDHVIRYEVDEQLSSDLTYVSGQLRRAGGSVEQGHYPFNNWHIDLVPTTGPMPPVFSDTLEFDLRERELVPVRKLTATGQAGNRTYRVVVKQPMGEFTEIAELLSISVIVAFLGLMGFLMALNGWVARRLWQPFFRLIEQLHQYRLDAQMPAPFAGSTIAEFDQLSVALNTMSQNLHRQYVGQKEFTDHAAHEMQTPLAIVTTQLDQLLATEPLTQEQVHYMEQAQVSIRRLTNLNRGLLLLTKIDNNQFADQHGVDLSKLVEKQVRDFSTYAQHRQLMLTSRIAPDVSQPMNPHLAEVLFSNLIKNAIIHATPGTPVEICLTTAFFKTSNVGPPLPFAPDQLFDRFVKNPARPESTGLGLALVRQIADRCGMTVRYAYDLQAETHTFEVQFPAP